MFGFFKGKGTKRTEAEEKAIAVSGGAVARRGLARDERASQEILYYLALHDPSASVRKDVARNPSMPVMAASLLAKDADGDVRYVLAKRLVRMLPDLSGDQHSQLYAYAVQSLGMLALDEVLKIRRALAETLKDHAYAPPAVAASLARDLEREVAEPILRFCAALADDDLVDILKTHPANWAAEAVANRPALSDRVSRAVIDTGNVRAGAILLRNEGAEIAPDLLESIVERAREVPEWHAPIAARKSLPPLMAMKLSAYVGKTVMQILERRGDLDPALIAEMSLAVRRRMEYEDERKKAAGKGDPEARAKALSSDGMLTETVVVDALAMHDNDFALACLAVRGGFHPKDVRRIFEARAPKSICALVWAAGFSMRTALKFQQMPGRVPPMALIYPRGGTDYPMAEADLRRQLAMLGLPDRGPPGGAS